MSQLGPSRAALEDILGHDWRQVVTARRSQIFERVGHRTDVLLFGTGALGKQACADLPEPFRVVAFVDNNPALWGSEVLGLPVLSPDEARSHHGDRALWLITIYTNSRVIEQCRGLS